MYNVKMVLLLLLKNILSILENWKTVYNMSGMFNGHAPVKPVKIHTVLLCVDKLNGAMPQTCAVKNIRF